MYDTVDFEVTGANHRELSAQAEQVMRLFAGDDLSAWKWEIRAEDRQFNGYWRGSVRAVKPHAEEASDG